MSLVKIAEEVQQSFLNGIGRADDRSFDHDPVATKVLRERKKRLMNQANQFYNVQSKAYGGVLPKEVQEMRDRQVNSIEKDYPDALRQYSINRTKQVAMKNPEQFQELQQLSAKSDGALAKANLKEGGIALGGIAGAGLGLALGKRLPKKTNGYLQRGVSTVLGGAAGGTVGGAIGSMKDEQRTGFNHEDVLKPYEIADRITNQKKWS